MLGSLTLDDLQLDCLVQITVHLLEVVGEFFPVVLFELFFTFVEFGKWYHLV